MSGIGSLVKRVGGKAVVPVVALVVAGGVTHVLFPVRVPEGASPGSEEMQRFHDRVALAPWVCLFVWVVMSYLLDKLYTRWRARRDAPKA